MSWLARLKTGKTPDTYASKTTETLFVVSVAPTLASLQKNEGATVAANDPAPAPKPIAAAVDIGTVGPTGLSPLLLAASLALDASIVAAGISPDLDPDAHCRPYSTAMKGAEIDLFTARLHRFTDKGLARNHGEALADKLVVRDREHDDRRVCLECRHFAGHGAGSWRCGNWQTAGVAIRLRDAQLPADLVVQLQRCDGFTAHPTSTLQGTDDEHDRH
jgi:hypothetical protein